MNVMNLGAVGATGYILNPTTVVEMAVETGGVSAESEASGIVMNMVPKEGGNTFDGSISGFFTNDKMQANNLTDDLRARGLTTPNEVLHLYDFGVAIGGPIKQDRLWFFTAPRFAGNKNLIPGVVLQPDSGHALLHAGPGAPGLQVGAPEIRGRAVDVAGITNE